MAIDKKQTILFFADRLPPCIGGMEMHAQYFIEHFTNHSRFPLIGTVTKNADCQDCLKESPVPVEISNLPQLFDPAIVFFNSGRWIEELENIRRLFPQSIFVYRTGGNEILKAPLIYKHIPKHSERQAYWTKTLNQAIDLLITNSAYTESRLRSLGITCSFMRFVGGVNSLWLKSTKTPSQGPLIIFCAARFVPYKNHARLINLFQNLRLRGHNLKLKLAGDGPLLEPIQELVIKLGLTPFVDFLGVLNNEKTCQEIAQANIYMQLSSDKITEVPGGSYVHSECMGRSILEALTAGTFVVAGKGGALGEVVTKERGLLVEIDQVEKMTDQIDELLKKPLNILPFHNEFCWSNIFRKYEEALVLCIKSFNDKFGLKNFDTEH
jgi:glycosyltransferase involved in cell wall biosynthesis